MRLQRMLGHLPALMHKDPKSVLIVGFGAGVTAGSFVPYPEIKRIVICEMEPLIPPTATKYFGKQNYFVVNDPRTQGDLRRRAPFRADHARRSSTSSPAIRFIRG